MYFCVRLYEQNICKQRQWDGSGSENRCSGIEQMRDLRINALCLFANRGGNFIQLFL